MCIALIGGMDRLERHYLEEAGKFGVDLRVFNCSEAKFKSKIRNVDALIIFTDKVSHNGKKQAVSAARANAIPVVMHHSSGICTLRECLGCIKDIRGRKEECAED